MPPAARIDLRPGRTGPVGGASVLLVALGIKPGIVPAALLPHEFEQRLAHAFSGLLSNLERNRVCRAEAHDKPALLADGAEIEFGMVVPSPPDRTRHRRRRPAPHHSLIRSIQHFEVPDERLGRKGDGDLRIAGTISQQVHAQVDRARAVCALR